MGGTSGKMWRSSSHLLLPDWPTTDRVHRNPQQEMPNDFIPVLFELPSRAVEGKWCPLGSEFDHPANKLSFPQGCTACLHKHRKWGLSVSVSMATAKKTQEMLGYQDH